MSDKLLEDQHFKNQNYSEAPLEIGEYENCEFSSCIFAKADLRNIKFTDCNFTECDLSMANVFETGFRSCSFDTCKMLGIEFHEVNTFLFLLKANDCSLSHSSFANLDLKKSVFTDCLFEECNFENANLSSSKLSGCDFSRAEFGNTNLKATDLSSCFNLILNPDENQINKAIFSKNNVAGLLSKYGIKVI